MTLKDLLRICRENFVVLIIATVVGLAGAFGYLAITKPTYTATATAYVTVNVSDVNQTAVGNFTSASQLALQKTQAYVPLFSDRSTAEVVKSKLGLPESSSAIASRLKATAKQNTLTVSVSATADSAELSQRIADTAVEATSDRVTALEGQNSPVRVQLMSSATLSTPAKSPAKTTTLGLGLIVGLLVGIAIAVLRAALDVKIYKDTDLKRVSELPVLTTLPESTTIARTDTSGVDDGSLEYIRKLRTGLQYAQVDGDVRSILFTSSMPAEGKSSVALALARVMAMAGNNVVLIDADLRRPTVHRSFGLSNPIGLSQLLAGTVDLDSAVCATDTRGLFIIPAGDIVPNPSELLGSNRMKDLLKVLRKHYIVIIDGPPLLPVTDSALVANSVDLTVLVVRAGQTKFDEVARSIDLLTGTGGALAGFVLNRAKTREMAKYGYGYAPDEIKEQRRRTRFGRGKKKSSSSSSTSPSAP